MRFIGVCIETPDVEAARVAYATLLDVAPTGTQGAPRFALDRGVVELTEGEPGRATLLFRKEAPDDAWPTDAATFHGMPIRVDPAAPDDPGTNVGVAVDHVVVFTPSPARAIALWRDRFGLRLAFDKEFPARNVRLLFFRSGGLTLEYASALPAPPDVDAPDRFYGVSYRVTDLDGRRARLLAAGVDVSEIRTGNKAGTRVASVRSGTGGAPTLLLEDEARRA
jgi:catechol 2,3-dioxygenase-like lactoylglutathione lyase family enzyme